MLSKDFAYVLKKLGAPETYARPREQTLADWKGRVPDELIEFWRHCGWSSFHNGCLWMPNPDDFTPLVETVLGNEKNVDYKKCYVIAYTAFGNIFIWSEEACNIDINLTYGWVNSLGIISEKKHPHPERIVAIPFTGDVKNFDRWSNTDDKYLYTRAVKKLGKLEPGECFGFFPAQILGGTDSVDNLKRVRALEHFIILGQTTPLNLMAFEGYKMVTVRPFNVA